MTATLRSFGELKVVLALVPIALQNQRRMRRLTLRAAAAEIGVVPSVLMRIEQGRNYQVSSLMLILEWLNGNSEQRDGTGGADHPVEERGQPRLDLVAGSGVEGDSGAA